MQVNPEDLGVHEEPDQLFGLTTVAVGDRGADQDVFLPAVAAEQGSKSGQRGHVQRGAGPKGRGVEGVAQLSR